MKLSELFLIVAIALFVLSAVPKVSRAWMIGLGLALFAASFLSFFSMRLG